MYANLVKALRGHHRRIYPDDFKTQMVAACLQPGEMSGSVVWRDERKLRT
jgi:transposase-like protein